MDTRAHPSLGFAVVPTLAPSHLRDIAVAAEASGLDELWVWEDSFKQSAIASASAALAWTTSIRVGIGLMPAPLRNVALASMELATLSGMFPGRLIAGIGHGVQEWMGQAGERVASPLTLLREYAQATRALLAGESVSTPDGRYVVLDGVQLRWPPTVPPPLMIGGAGPKTLELAGSLGDGTLLGNVLTRDELRRTHEIVSRAHAASTGPTAGREHSIVTTLIAATGEGAQDRVDAECRRWDKPDGDGIAIAGDADAIADHIRSLTQYGITSVVIEPTEDEPDLLGFIRFLGEKVRPLLASPEGSAPPL
ncbi:LLM class flavin-dependent oxidoreductase [Glaciihabitans sp. dw_435]|uniref:LLM class flavin-dependent oxidoreductase n=1 Tax=Glaciihabitans sp. dw_435 TaxID=2720081 RepID=UPI001BD203EB|nr:LLM class flavin-dependent oxidoreductase [Glaciihabitans sp. dw_435]